MCGLSDVLQKVSQLLCVNVALAAMLGIKDLKTSYFEQLCCYMIKSCEWETTYRAPALGSKP